MDSKSWVAERDKLHHHIMTAVSESQLKETTVFKGGTALRLCWFSIYRYSEDLDFDIIASESEWATAKDDFYNGLESVLRSASNSSGVEMLLDRTANRTNKWKIVCIYDNEELDIKLDIKQMKEWAVPVYIPIIPRYPKVYGEIFAHSLESVLISKFDCISGERTKYTDLYDILALAEKTDFVGCWQQCQSLIGLTSKEMFNILADKESAMKQDYTKRIQLLEASEDLGFDETFYGVLELLDSLNG